MQIDCQKHLAFSGNASFKTDSIIDPTEHVDLSGSGVKMAVVNEKYTKARKDSYVSISSKSTKQGSQG